MVVVKGPSNSTIAAATFLGLAEDAIQITERFHDEDVIVDATGSAVPNAVDQQIYGFNCFITMNLVHYDPLILQEVIRLGAGGGTVEGTAGRAGTLLGGNLPLYTPGNNLVSLGILSPVGGIPWRFFGGKITGDFAYPLGTKRSIVRVNWRYFTYLVDPWNNGLGLTGTPVYDHGLLV